MTYRNINSQNTPTETLSPQNKSPQSSSPRILHNLRPSRDSKRKTEEEESEPKKRTKINTSDSKILIEKFSAYSKNWEKLFTDIEVKELMKKLGTGNFNSIREK